MSDYFDKWTSITDTLFYYNFYSVQTGTLTIRPYLVVVVVDYCSIYYDLRLITLL